MDNPNLPKVVDIPPNWQKWSGPGSMLIPSPRQVEALIRAVPKGRLITVAAIRAILAAEHMAGIACPLTTGIFVRIAAEAAEEDARAGKTRITPYWRVVKDDGSLNPKFPGGVEPAGGEAARRRPPHHAREGQAPTARGGGVTKASSAAPRPRRQRSPPYETRIAPAECSPRPARRRHSPA